MVFLADGHKRVVVREVPLVVGWLHVFPIHRHPDSNLALWAKLADQPKILWPERVMIDSLKVRVKAHWRVGIAGFVVGHPTGSEKREKDRKEAMHALGRDV